MAGIPDGNDMSWEFTHAPILFTATTSLKRTFNDFLEDHPEPSAVAYQAEGPVEGRQEGWAHRFTVTCLTLLCGMIQIAAVRAANSAKRRIVQSTRRHVPRVFRKLFGEAILEPITPPRPRPYIRYRIPGTYPPSPTQATAISPSPARVFRVPSPSPSPISDVAYHPTTTIPGMYSDSPSPAQAYTPTPLPSPAVASPVTPTLSPVSMQSPSPMRVDTQPKVTPPAVRELRKLRRKHCPWMFNTWKGAASSKRQYPNKSINSSPSSSSELSSQLSSPFTEYPSPSPPATNSEIQHAGESIESNRSSSTELPPQTPSPSPGATTSETQHAGESIESNRSSSNELSPQEHQSLQGASSTHTNVALGGNYLAMLRRANSARISSKKKSPLRDSFSNVNTQRTLWPRKTVSFPEDPVTRVKKYAKGETISFPSPTSSGDENGILSMHASPEAQWSSPTQAEQEAYLDEQMKDISTSPATSETDLSTILLEMAMEDQPAGRRGSRRSARKAEEEAALAMKEAEEEKEKARQAEEEQARIDKEAAEEEAKRAASFRRMPLEPVIQPLCADWEVKVTAALARPMNAQVAHSVTATPISRRDIGRVVPQAGRDPANGWLNDEVINAYLQATVHHIHEKAKHRRGQTPIMHAFNPFFWSNLDEYGPEKVARWAGKAKFGGATLLNVEQIFIPINRGGNHWTLAVVSPTSRTIEIFDSMHGSSAGPIGKIRAWLARELGIAYHAEEWKVMEDPAHRGKGKGPTQDNSSDCGVFTVTTAKMVALGVHPMAVSAEDMPLQRRRIVAELMNGGFSGAFEPNVVFS